MKPLPMIPFLLLSALLALGGAGCATPNVNPPQALANTGYVDFRADGAGELFWRVERFDAGAKGFREIFSELAPPAGGILRLAFTPGRHHLRITFLNRLIEKPAEVDVEVPDGKIIPVRVACSAAGAAHIATRDISYGGTARGHVGRRVKYGSDEAVMEALSAVADPPVAYQLKEQMPYAR